MIETEGVNLFDRMRPAYQKWAEPVTARFRARCSRARRSQSGRTCPRRVRRNWVTCQARLATGGVTLYSTEEIVRG
jgi:hypothetical protein